MAAPPVNAPTLRLPCGGPQQTYPLHPRYVRMHLGLVRCANANLSHAQADYKSIKHLKLSPKSNRLIGVQLRDRLPQPLKTVYLIVAVVALIASIAGCRTPSRLAHSRARLPCARDTPLMDLSALNKPVTVVRSPARPLQLAQHFRPSTTCSLTWQLARAQRQSNYSPLTCFTASQTQFKDHANSID